MQDIRENPTRTAQRARQGLVDRAEDETTGRQFRQIGDHRGDKAANVELAGFDEFAHGIFGALERAHQRLADVTTDVARLGGVIAEGRYDGIPTGLGGFGTIGGGCTRPTARCPTGRSDRLVEPVGGIGGPFAA